MKTVLAILLSVIVSNSFSQDTIRSIKLDSLIWEKINEYRLTQNAEPFVVFEDSLMRDFANRVANRNISLFPTKHSSDLGYWSNSECLYTTRESGSFTWDEDLERILNQEFDLLANEVVQGWIHSPTHEHQISRPDIDVATIVTIIIVDVDNKKVRLDATFEGLSNEPNSTFDNTYVYPR